MPRPKGLPKTGGRVAGTPNKISGQARDNIAQVFAKLGDVEGMTAWAQDHPTEFYKLYARLLPSEVEVADVTDLSPAEREARARALLERAAARAHLKLA